MGGGNNLLRYHILNVAWVNRCRCPSPREYPTVGCRNAQIVRNISFGTSRSSGQKVPRMRPFGMRPITSLEGAGNVEPFVCRDDSTNASQVYIETQNEPPVPCPSRKTLPILPFSIEASPFLSLTTEADPFVPPGTCL